MSNKTPIESNLVEIIAEQDGTPAKEGA